MSASPRKWKSLMGGLQRLLAAQFPTTRRDGDWKIDFEWAGAGVPFACYCEANPHLAAFLFRAILPLPFAPATRPAVAEYLHRANADLPVLGWAFDPDSGEVRWKAGVYFGDGEPAESLVVEVLNSSFALVRLHVLGLVKLANGEPLADALAAFGREPGEDADEA
jgi:hypothetical protein